MAATRAGTRGTARAAQAGETRQRLLDAAVRLFAERGYDEVAVADIAEAAGVAHGLLYHHFGNKREIYLAVMRQTAEELNASLVLRPDLPPQRQIREALASHLRYLAAHKGLSLRLILGGRGADPEAWATFEDARWRAIEWLAAVAGMDPQRPAVRMTGRAIVAAIDEGAAYWLDDGETFAVETIVEWIIQLATSAARAAALLDPSLDIDAALAKVFVHPML
ncbi:TetR/AcrR family transcriptional regulator [Nocardia sp. NPDC049526]|uniref:TetR/AcrR family transcriptional regulator n=1 Tax=Nocardia sp. NPDC049526 TaxID=3364316 RepID=UPI0037B5F8E9